MNVCFGVNKRTFEYYLGLLEHLVQFMEKKKLELNVEISINSEDSEAYFYDFLRTACTCNNILGNTEIMSSCGIWLEA